MAPVAFRGFPYLARGTGARSRNPPPFTVVNSASYGNFIAPDSIATIFGSNLSFGTATAVLDDDGQLPTVLGQTRVEINGVAARSVFRIAGADQPAGSSRTDARARQPCVVRSTATGATQNGTAQVAAGGPGIFASDGSGSGPGAILNAINFHPAPFLVLTDDGASAVRTVLAVYRHRPAQRRHGDARWHRIPRAIDSPWLSSLPVAAPGFFGLDQVNVLLPPDIDGAGTVQLILTADDFSANVVTFQMDFIPAVLVRPALLTLSPDVVTAGDSTMLTVGLTGVARNSGYPVGLQSSNAAAPVIAQLTVPAGKASAQTTVTTAAVTSTTMATFAASGSGVTLTATLEIDPVSTVQLAGMSVSPPSLLGGRNRTGTVTLTGNAPAGGVKVLTQQRQRQGARPGVGHRAVRQEFGGFHDHDAARDQRADSYADGHAGPHSVSTAVLTLLPPLQLVAGRERGGGRESGERHGDAGRPGAGDGRHRHAAIRRYRGAGRAGQSSPPDRACRHLR